MILNQNINTGLKTNFTKTLKWTGNPIKDTSVAIMNYEIPSNYKKIYIVIGCPYHNRPYVFDENGGTSSTVQYSRFTVDVSNGFVNIYIIGTANTTYSAGTYIAVIGVV